MKKLFFASIFALATLTACQNDSTDSGFTPITEKTTSSKLTARDGRILTADEALELTKNDEDAVAVNASTGRVIWRGELLPIATDSNTDKRKSETICKGKEGNLTISIQHVYDDHYSGYEFVVTYPDGSYSSSPTTLGPLRCPAIWIFN